MFRFDTHVHTSEVSPCGNVSAAELVSLYYEAGYSGICITDHFRQDIIEKLEGDNTQRIDGFLRGYENAVAAAKHLDFSVLLGLEVKLPQNYNEYLIFGVTREFLIENIGLYLYNITQLSELVRKNNLFLFQAHPMRYICSPAPHELLDGYEVYNGNPRHQSNNADVLLYAEKLGVKKLSGSDCHEIGDVGQGGIITDKPITSNEIYLDILKRNDYKLIGNEERN